MSDGVLIEIIENIKEAAAERKKEKIDDVGYGELIGLAESLSIIQDACAGYDLKSLGLDFDIDKTYL